MATPDDSARPVKSNGLTSFQDGYQFHTAADWNNEAIEIFAKHNSGMATLYTHASRHQAGAADAVSPASIGAPGVLRYWSGYHRNV